MRASQRTCESPPRNEREGNYQKESCREIHAYHHGAKEEFPRGWFRWQRTALIVIDTPHFVRIVGIGVGR